jgi:hypothetical protein
MLIMLIVGISQTRNKKGRYRPVLHQEMQTVKEEEILSTDTGIETCMSPTDSGRRYFSSPGDIRERINSYGLVYYAS